MTLTLHDRVATLQDCLRDVTYEIASFFIIMRKCARVKGCGEFLSLCAGIVPYAHRASLQACSLKNMHTDSLLEGIRSLGHVFTRRCLDTQFKHSCNHEPMSVARDPRSRSGRSRSGSLDIIIFPCQTHSASCRMASPQSRPMIARSVYVRVG